MKKRIIGIALTIIMMLMLSCQKDTAQKREADKLSDQTTNHSKIKFGLVTGTGGLGDKAFNDMQYNGMLLAGKKFGIRYDYDAPEKIKDEIKSMEKLIKNGATVIFAGGGFHMVNPVDSLARIYPDVRFIILDDFAKEYLPNVASVTFRQNEGSFLAGALSTMMSQSQSIGLIASADRIKVIQDFIVGFKSGALYINPQIRCQVKYIGNVDDAISPFNNPGKAYSLTKSLIIDHKADVVYQVASGSGLGVFNACKEMKKYAIGVDSDQDYLAEGVILTSMMKRLDNAILMMTEIILNNRFENKNYSLGLKEKGVSLSPMRYTRDKIPSHFTKQLSQIEKQIIEGTIHPTSAYE